MKRLFIFSICSLFILNLHAQSNAFKDSIFSSWQNNRYFFNHAEQSQQKNKLINPKTFFMQKIKPVDPSVLKLPKSELTFVTNYNHSDIYQSSPDNMFIIKPDSTLIFSMPVADNN